LESLLDHEEEEEEEEGKESVPPKFLNNVLKYNLHVYWV
jgi:hypothetical protein